MSDSTETVVQEMEKAETDQRSSPRPAATAQTVPDAADTEHRAETTTQVREDVVVPADSQTEGKTEEDRRKSPEQALTQGTVEKEEKSEERAASPVATHVPDGAVLAKPDVIVDVPPTVVRADSPSTPRKEDKHAAAEDNAPGQQQLSPPQHLEEPKSSATERSLAEEEILSRIEDVEDWAEEEKSEPEEGPFTEEEPEEKESLDDDRDRRKPQYIPRGTAYFLHDDRDAVSEAAASEEEGSPDEEEAEKTEGEPAAEGKKKERKKEDDRWAHDLYSADAAAEEPAARGGGYGGRRGMRGARRGGRYGRGIGMRRGGPVRRVRGGRMAAPGGRRVEAEEDAGPVPAESQDEPEKENQRVEEKKKERSAEMPAHERKPPATAATGRQPTQAPYRPPRRGRPAHPPYEKSAPVTPRYQDVEDWDYDEDHFAARESYGRPPPPPQRMRGGGRGGRYAAPPPPPPRRGRYEEEYEDEYEEYERGGDVGSLFQSRVFLDGDGDHGVGGMVEGRRRGGDPPGRRPDHPRDAHRLQLRAWKRNPAQRRRRWRVNPATATTATLPRDTRRRGRLPVSPTADGLTRRGPIIPKAATDASTTSRRPRPRGPPRPPPPPPHPRRNAIRGAKPATRAPPPPPRPRRPPPPPRTTCATPTPTTIRPGAVAPTTARWWPRATATRRPRRIITRITGRPRIIIRSRTSTPTGPRRPSRACTGRIMGRIIE
ncbi:serine/arginine repetitive matrix protein 1-like isoform X2 [Paramacrobiotus metropolitanus]|uniref:serine/arginine repetitive matrix protein 1-like isoform X2 n=1 Tax=Paramacrobiotus metropolitanus TaxID=2943436 RepID=UPI002445B0E9|nr:serine/arginine repetitive matrix protein 1-like isoform X2 [Paramacrobiotus metropolitanus]